ncbi:MAG: hypothetical protein AB7P21_31250 [Lautropia sp.]
MPPTRIVFGVMSAIHPAPAVQDLVDALGPRHRVLVHHDFSQQADFSVGGAQVAFVDDPVQTGWGEWAFTQGIVHLLEAALAGPPFDYFQLLSPTCLPVRPIEELERHLVQGGADFLADFLRLDDDPTALMSHGWRAYAREGSLRFRLLRRCYLWYFSHGLHFENRAGLGFPLPPPADAPLPARLRASACRWVMRLAARGNGFSHAFSAQVPCHAGSTWFCASRRGCEYLVARAHDVGVARRFSEIHMPDEFFFPTMIAVSGMPVLPATHHVSRFDGARPAWLGLDDLPEIDASRRFFARKFRVEPDDALRVAIRRRREAHAGAAAARDPASSVTDDRRRATHAGPVAAAAGAMPSETPGAG